MKKLTYEEFGKVMHEAMKILHLSGVNNKPWRLGQCISNATSLNYPDLVISLRGTGADCFYNDSKIIHFIDAILEK